MAHIPSSIYKANPLHQPNHKIYFILPADQNKKTAKNGAVSLVAGPESGQLFFPNNFGRAPTSNWPRKVSVM